MSCVKNCALIEKTSDTSLWHLRYGHLNVKGLKLSGQKNMVIGLPKIDDLGFCEGCVYRKQSRDLFPVNKAWRASSCLELVHRCLWSYEYRILRWIRYLCCLLMIIDE